MRTLQHQAKLIRWYQSHHRNLPWRSTRDPYRIWISETMLQQTRVETVIPYYLRFLKRFPSVRQLASARLSSVLKVWEGLGYYARARHLHRAARIIQRQYRGGLPTDYDLLRQIPGVGDYTAAAIASLAFDRPTPVLDGNVRRVLARWIALREDPRSRAGEMLLRAAAEKFLARSDPGAWNQAVMELGAIICTARKPRCGACPVPQGCEAFRLGLTTEIPIRRPKGPIPHYQVTAAVIENDGKILITRRPERGLLGGLWEFPGGKQEAGESLKKALRRELQEELGIDVRVGKRICAVDHAYSHFSITLHVFRCALISDRPKAIGCAEWKWVRPSQLSRYAFPRADRKVIELLAER